MESSQFSDAQPRFESMVHVDTNGATSDTYCVKLYGKLHFLKRLKPQFAADIRYVEAQRKEFETGYRLEHPNLVRYVALADDGILTEYVDGETLTERLRIQPDYFSSRRNTDKLLRQLLDVVGYLHAHQVLHLDLKPDNILLTRIGSDVKLIDLGCCLTDTFIDTQGHTQGFAAPEQLSGGAVDERTDIYAIGKILERLPRHSIYNKVVARCTAKEPAARYQSVAEILHDVNRQHSLLRYILAAATVLVIALCAFVFSQRTVPETAELTPHDTIPPSEAPLPSVEVAQQPSSETAQQQAPTVAVQEKLPSSPPENQEALMKADLEQLMDKAYEATIQTFCDSVFPSPSVGEQWRIASTEFHRQAVQIGDSLVNKYPNLSESAIRQEAENRFQTLVSYVFNKMRENGENSSEP